MTRERRLIVVPSAALWRILEDALAERDVDERNGLIDPTGARPAGCADDPTAHPALSIAS